MALGMTGIILWELAQMHQLQRLTGCWMLALAPLLFVLGRFSKVRRLQSSNVSRSTRLRRCDGHSGQRNFSVSVGVRQADESA